MGLHMVLTQTISSWEKTWQEVNGFLFSCRYLDFSRSDKSLIFDTLVDIFGKLTLLVWIFLFYFRINWVIVFPDMDVYSLTFVSRLVGKLSIFSVKYTPICYENHFGQACWSKVGKMKILAMESCVYARKVKKLLPDFEFFVWIRQLK